MIRTQVLVSQTLKNSLHNTLGNSNCLQSLYVHQITFITMHCNKHKILMNLWTTFPVPKIGEAFILVAKATFFCTYYQFIARKEQKPLFAPID